MTGPRRVLVVDDEPHILELVGYTLRREGFEVSTAADGQTALARLRAEEPDLVILDLMLPGLDGREVCRRIRGESAVPVIMLTARGREEDRVAGLDLGADDYVTKPFSPREMVARVRAVLRRRAREVEPSAREPLRAAGLRLDPATREVRLHGRPVELTAREFDLLWLFMRSPNRVFTREVLLEHLWGHDFEGTTRTVDMHVSRLREKIEDDPGVPTFIVTVRGVGYKLRAAEPAARGLRP